MEETAEEVIIPPPELRKIIDKTAAFVGKNGKAFEKRILDKNVGNIKFDFLNQTNPFNKYYLQAVDKVALKIHQQTVESTAEQKQKQKQEEGSIEVDEEKAKEDMEVAVEKKPKLKAFADIAKKTQRQEEIKKPRDFQFLIKHPNLQDYSTAAQITPKQIEVLKLAAQSAAVLGQDFVDRLSREQKLNREFDFLRSSNRFHRYFLALVDSYVKLVDKEERQKQFTFLEREFDTRARILERCVQRVEYKKQQLFKEAEKLRKDSDEKVSYVQIDWGDFVVVETLDFDDESKAMSDAYNSTVEMSRRTEQRGREAKEVEEEEDSDDDMEVDMDSESESEGEEEANQLRSQDIKIVSNYEPKVVETEEREKLIVLPTGQKISAENVNEHVKIDMIDPEAREQKQKFLDRKQVSVYAEGDISRNLKRLAQRRPDVFGAGDKEEEEQEEEEEVATKRRRG